MKKNYISITTKMALVSLLFISASSFAQTLTREDFNYDANRALILNPVVSSANTDAITGWSTQSNTSSAINAFSITSGGLSYLVYNTTGIGNALKYSGATGQSVFKSFDTNYQNGMTFYVSFLINFPNTAVDGSDYFIGVKMATSATATTWGARFFAKVDPANTNKEVTVGINKSSDVNTSWLSSGNELTAGQTYLFVMKYSVGILNGTNATEEAGKYDDVMTLFINPAVGSGEPSTPTLVHSDATVQDIYRYSSTGSILGGAQALYLRSSATGKAPAYTIDDIRVGATWTDVIPNSPTTFVKDVTTTPLAFVSNSKLVVLKNAEVYNSVGLKVATVKSNQRTELTLQSGIYIVKSNDSILKVRL